MSAHPLMESGSGAITLTRKVREGFVEGGGSKILLAEGWGVERSTSGRGEGSEEGPLRWTVRTATDATASSSLPSSP